MKFGELTIAQILLAAFFGFGSIIFSWVFGKKIIGRFRSKDKLIEITQNNNKIQGDMAGGDIIKANTIDQIESKRTATKVNQTDNKVGGDMAGGNIVKKD
jgi:hypothetical protein